MAGYRYWFPSGKARDRSSHRTVFSSSSDEPAQNASGMTGVYLDMAGHLHYFTGVPPQRATRQPTRSALSTGLGFSMTRDSDQSGFHPVTPSWVPLQPFDARVAWDGHDPAHPEYAIHVEAAAFHGRPVYFETIYPWDHPARQQEVTEGAGWRAAVSVSIVVFLLARSWGVACWRQRICASGVAIVRGAFRLASFYFVMRMLWIVDVHHVTALAREFGIFIRTACVCSVRCGLRMAAIHRA